MRSGAADGVPLMLRTRVRLPRRACAQHWCAGRLLRQVRRQQLVRRQHGRRNLGRIDPGAAHLCASATSRLLCIFARPPVPRAHDALTLFRGSHLAHVLSAAANGHQRGMSLGASPRPGYAAPPAPETPRRRPSESCVCVRTRSTAPLPHCPSVCTRASAASACPLLRLCKRVNSLRLGPDPWPPPGRRATLSLSTCRLQGLKQQKARTFSLAQIPKEPKAVTPYYKE